MPVNRVKRNGSYAPLSAHYYKDDAIDEAGEAAELLYVRGLAFCADVLSDGFISDRQLVRFVGVGMFDAPERAQRLVEVELWDRVDGGFTVRSWLDWNRSREEITDFQKKDADRKRPAGRKDSKEPPATPPDGGRTDSERNPDGVHVASGSLSSAGARARSTNLHSSPTSFATADAVAETKTVDDWFDEYWVLWPRKVAKQPAKAKYRAAVKSGADPEFINRVARDQVNIWRSSGKIANDLEHIPHASTWLHQCRFNDEIENPNQTVLSVVPDLPVSVEAFRERATGSGARKAAEEAAQLIHDAFIPDRPRPRDSQLSELEWVQHLAAQYIDDHADEIRQALERRMAG